MAEPTDLFAILRFYANRTHTPTFAVDVFISFLEKYAKRYADDRPGLAPWAQDTSRKVWEALPRLSESGKCSISTDERGTLVSVSQYFVDLVQHVYRSIEDNPELPFPDETTLKTVVPPSQLRTVSLEADLIPLMNDEADPTRPIIKLVFPESSGSAILLSNMIPRKLLEISLIKIRHYLRSHNNKDYVQHKLAPAFQGKESQLKEALNQLMMRPFDTMSEMEKAGDFSFPFWAYFSSLVKADIRKKNDRLPEDIAAIQSVFVLELFNNFYKGKATKERESETAFKNLDLQLEKPPYYYSLDDIVRFTDTKGVPLLGQYTREGLEEFIKRKTTSGDLNTLPDLLIVHGLNGERWFVRKSRLLPLCVKLLGEARPRIKTTLSQRWFKLMSDYRTEAAMEDDQAFDKELWDLSTSISPTLAAVLQEKTLFLVHDELEGTEAGIPEAGRLFYKGALASMSELYLLARKDLLIDVRMLLPFWHSVPFFAQLIAFFKGLGKGKVAKKHHRKQKNTAPTTDEADEKYESNSVNRKTELKKAAVIVQKKLVPEGMSLDTYLHELEDRWNRIINQEAKENLTEDVNSLIRDYLRRTIRTLRAAAFTNERIAELSDALAETPALLKLPSRDSLRLYIQVYMVKLILKS
ncbi:hypothetical protein MASR2M78_09940 [Treponema sp.]